MSEEEKEKLEKENQENENENNTPNDDLPGSSDAGGDPDADAVDERDPNQDLFPDDDGGESEADADGDADGDAADDADGGSDADEEVEPEYVRIIREQNEQLQRQIQELQKQTAPPPRDFRAEDQELRQQFNQKVKDLEQAKVEGNVSEGLKIQNEIYEIRRRHDKVIDDYQAQQQTQQQPDFPEPVKKQVEKFKAENPWINDETLPQTQYAGGVIQSLRAIGMDTSTEEFWQEVHKRVSEAFPSQVKPKTAPKPKKKSAKRKSSAPSSGQNAQQSTYKSKPLPKDLKKYNFSTAQKEFAKSMGYFDDNDTARGRLKHYVESIERERKERS